jgi:uncharacterized membrane protein
MRPPFYLRQLKRDLDTWIAKGLVPADSRDAILASVGGTTRSLDVIFAVLGVILIGAGAMSFVAANWASMGKLERLIVLFGSMWAAYALAMYFMSTARGAIGQAFVLLGTILFGVNIWYVAQTYNISAHYPDGTLMWGLGAMAAALLVPSRAALALAIGLGGLWTWQETQYFDHILHLPFLLYWAVGAAAAGFLNWRPGIHLSALGLIFWFLVNYEGLRAVLGWGPTEIATLYILIPLAIWSTAQFFDRDATGLGLAVGHYAFFMFLGVYSLLHFTNNDSHPITTSWMFFSTIMSAVAIGAVMLGIARKLFTGVDLAGTAFACVTTIAYVLMVNTRENELKVPFLAATLLVILWSISRGARNDDRFVINLSIVAFGLWLLYVYFDLFAGLMDQAVFLTLGGILLILISLTLEGVRRRLIAGTKPSTEGAAS